MGQLIAFILICLFGWLVIRLVWGIAILFVKIAIIATGVVVVLILISLILFSGG